MPAEALWLKVWRGPRKRQRGVQALEKELKLRRGGEGLRISGHTRGRSTMATPRQG